MNKKKRFSVLKRCGFKCVYCGREPPEVTLHVDHRTSRVAGGGDEDDNLVAACSDCNFGKGATSDQDDDGIVIVFAADGSVDHERSLKLSGMWASTPKELRKILTTAVFTPPPEIAIFDMQHELNELRRFKSIVESEGSYYSGESFEEVMVRVNRTFGAK